MKFDTSIFKNDEKAIYTLRALYRSRAYKPFKMRKFESYDLYAKHKEVLVSEGVITFTDTDGKLLALKPDVTLSIIKNARCEAGTVERYYYNENVYRTSERTHAYREIMQTGLECIGDIGAAEVKEVVALAAESLSLIDEDFVLVLSHVGLVSALLADCGVTDVERVLRDVVDKNLDALRAETTPAQFAICRVLVGPYTSVEAACEALADVAKSDAAATALAELSDVCEHMDALGWGDKLQIDFSLVGAAGYYSGVVFGGFLSGIASRVLSGGRYDTLMRRMGKSGGAVGFAVYLDALERLSDLPPAVAKPTINVALPKGRLGEKVYEMFEKAGFPCPSIREQNRKLIFENEELRLRFFWVKPSDVAIYVARGAADVGVAGKDILLEYQPDVYELLDLDIGKCRMAVAAKKDFVDDPSRTLRVATKFERIAKTYYEGLCREIDIIHLNGSIELAPILGLSDVIVDIVETGKTLLENDLAPYETIVPISARLIANRASYTFKTTRIEEIKAGLQQEVAARKDRA